MSRYGSTEKSVTCVDGIEETLEVPNIIFDDVKEGNRFYEIRTPRVTEIVRNHFDCMVLTGARLEQGRDSIGCFGGFLDDVSVLLIWLLICLYTIPIHHCHISTAPFLQ